MTQHQAIRGLRHRNRLRGCGQRLEGRGSAGAVGLGVSRSKR
jgi:hypothetical protein